MAILQLSLGIVLILKASLVKSGTVAEGGVCSTANDHIDPVTQKFITECAPKTFCSGPVNGTCTLFLCRRDEFPFGYETGEALPPLCGPGEFCPDEGSGCSALLDVDSPCQMGRDEQCASPDDWAQLASPQNFNGSICLNSLCMYANVTLGQQCIIDSTTYTDVGPDGQQFANTVTRDNCRAPEFYCDAVSTVCMQTKGLGLPCQTDQECQTRNCGPKGICLDPPETPVKVAPWKYALTSLCIIGAMIATCALLTLIHKRHRLQHYQEIRDYYAEQISLRRSIIALHTAAADRHSYSDEKAYSVNF